jgi:dGTPase
MADLQPYAVTEQKSAGRQHSQKTHPFRGDFQRDRDRVIHSEAFRRLEGKTQVFTPGIDDNFRNRLTHSIEVAQIARTIASELKINETLTEAVCLAHDIGHSPFGHEGEKTLNELTEYFGGFEHNAQALRIVDIIETPYPNFQGLNLMYETRLAIALHSTTYDHSNQNEFDQKNPPLEAQTADIADRIAYNCHDLEDGLRSRIITEQEIMNIELYRLAGEKINAGQIENSFIRRTRTAKAVIDILVTDCIKKSRNNIADEKIKRLEDIYSAKKRIINLTDDADKKLAQLESFLLHKMYHSDKLSKAAEKSRADMKELFGRLCREPDLMPLYYQQLAEQFGKQRGVCDYIAGMTDRYCRDMLRKLRS